MDTLEIQINEEFKRLIPPLTTEEYSQLEENILNDGIRDALCVWDNNGTHLLIDGHNRYKIATNHGLDFEVNPYEFNDENDVKLWMIDNQKGRRNLSDFVKYELSQFKADILREKGADKYAATVGRPSKESLSIIDNDKIDKHNTREEIAKDLNWSTGKVAMADVVMKTADAETKDKLRKNETSINKVYQEIKKKDKTEKLENKKKEITERLKKDIEIKPKLEMCHYLDYVSKIDDKSIDLIFTDPPYATDIDDIEGFAMDWVLAVLPKLKENGRAFICTGAYPNEILAYLKAFKNIDFIVDNPLIWTYRNTLGVTPKMKYNLNYQIVWHLYSDESQELDTSITNEMFSVQDINAPDGRQGDRYHTWQKPNELALRLIRHSTNEGDTVLDTFACTGTIPLMASTLGRIGLGCDISKENLLIAEKRGCDVKF